MVAEQLLLGSLIVIMAVEFSFSGLGNLADLEVRYMARA